MANYHNLKNAAILTPTGSTDLGSDANRYSNVFMSGNIVMSNGVTVTSTNVITPKVSAITYPGDDTAVNTAGGQTVTITGSGFSSGATAIIGSTPASSTTVVSDTSITFTTPALSLGTYVLYVINSDGGTATYIPGIAFSPTPVWTTAAGSLGTIPKNTSVNISVLATGDAPITYAVKAGSSLPSGLSLNTSTGAITGTSPNVGSDTTYNFTLTTTDLQKQDTDRAFSLIVQVVTAPSTVEYLVVAGGGAGSDTGAGGAGGYRSSVIGESSGGGAAAESPLAVSPSIAYTVTVGAGGTSKGNNSPDPGGSGTNSVFSSITSLGGGGGGGTGGGSVSNSATGGSGGGASGSPSNPAVRVGAAGTAGQGFAGGASVASYYTAGGGGGAGGAGGNASGNDAGNGGVGVASSITGSAVGYAGGGGGGGYNGVNSTGLGTSGGGNGELFGSSRAATSGTVNTGGGGGGLWEGAQSGAGGSGIVIIRYADTYLAATSTTGSPTITTAGGYRIYKYTASGTITF